MRGEMTKWGKNMHSGKIFKDNWVESTQSRKDVSPEHGAAPVRNVKTRPREGQDLKWEQSRVAVSVPKDGLVQRVLQHYLESWNFTEVPLNCHLCSRFSVYCAVSLWTTNSGAFAHGNSTRKLAVIPFPKPFWLKERFLCGGACFLETFINTVFSPECFSALELPW